MALSSLLFLACALTAHAESPLTNPIDEVDEADYQPSLLHHHPSLLLSSKSAKDSFACSDSCALADNGICEDGGYNAESNACAFGSDCSDCGVRGAEAQENDTANNKIIPSQRRELQNSEGWCRPRRWARGSCASDLCCGKGERMVCV